MNRSLSVAAVTTLLFLEQNTNTASRNTDTVGRGAWGFTTKSQVKHVVKFILSTEHAKSHAITYHTGATRALATHAS